MVKCSIPQSPPWRFEASLAADGPVTHDGPRERVDLLCGQSGTAWMTDWAIFFVGALTAAIAAASPLAARHAGDDFDGFGNAITVFAVSNPQVRATDPADITDRTPGYGVISFVGEDNGGRR
jgi:hypothetical protein